MTDKSELLRQCAASGQMDAAQIAAHQRAGDLEIAERTRRVQEHELRWTRDIGCESARPDLRPDLQRGDEPAAAGSDAVRQRIAGRALLLYAATLLATALAAAAIYLNT